MADLTTTWLGLQLSSPLVVAAGPIAQDPAAAAQAVAAGAGAIVMHSLFEEQLAEEQMAVHRLIDSQMDLNAEAGSFMPESGLSSLDGEAYLAEFARLKAAVEVPVIASLNGATPGGWTRYAKRLADAGADALELNLYDIATDSLDGASAVERRQLALVETVASAVSIPVAVKLSPFYTALPDFVRQLGTVGARGVTVFNRLYEPQVDIETLEIRRQLELSTAAELPQRLHALAVLSTTSDLSLACSGGVHDGAHAARAIACGAHVVQVASALLAFGPDRMAGLRAELQQWLDAHGYSRSADLRGVLNLSRSPDPAAWTRLNYIRTLDGWRSDLSRRTPS